jgi:hypothetical protein
MLQTVSADPQVEMRVEEELDVQQIIEIGHQPNVTFVDEDWWALNASDAELSEIAKQEIEQLAVLEASLEGQIALHEERSAWLIRRAEQGEMIAQEDDELADWMSGMTSLMAFKMSVMDTNQHVRMMRSIAAVTASICKTNGEDFLTDAYRQYGV